MTRHPLAEWNDEKECGIYLEDGCVGITTTRSTAHGHRRDHSTTKQQQQQQKEKKKKTKTMMLQHRALDDFKNESNEMRERGSLPPS